MRNYIDLVSDVQGNALFGASVAVTNFVGGGVAQIFSDNGLTPITGAVVTTDITGQFNFFAADGDYTLTISVSGSVYKIQTPVVLFDGAAQVTQADAGSGANVYASSSPVLEKVLRTGLRSWINAAHTNTGASTYSYNGLTAKAIVASDGSALTAGVLVSGGIFGMEYNGTAWQLIAVFLSASAIGSQLYPPNQAELTAIAAAGGALSIVSQFYNYNDFRRYGIIPNNPAVAAANTTILKALWNPNYAGPVGVFQLPIITGLDTWYFSGNIGVRDGVYLDGNGQTMSWAFAAALADNNNGLLTALRNCRFENVNITWNLTNASATSNWGNGFMFGGRQGTPTLQPQPIYDSLLASPMGNIIVRNVKMNGTASAAQSRAFFMLGGLVNMTFDNITIEGNAALLDGHYYEFGFATNPTDVNAAQSSYMQNARYTNWNVDNCVNSALSGNGACDVMVDGLISTNSNFPVAWGLGEAAFMKPWNPNNLAGAKHLIHLKNCVLSPLIAGGTAITLTGTSGTLAATATFRPQWLALHTYNNNGEIVFNGGNLYQLLSGQGSASGNTGGPTGTALSGITDGALTWGYVNKQASTDLLDSIIDNCTVLGNSGGYGVRLIGMTQVRVTGCYFTGCQRGLDSDADSTRITVEGCVIRDSTNVGIAFAGQGATGVYPSGRASQLVIKNNWIAGSTGAAISMTACLGSVVEGNRFGYETIHDDVAEASQLFAISIDANTFNCHVRNNYIAGVASGNTFAAASGGTTRNNRLENNTYNNAALQTAQGSWITDWVQAGAATAIASNGAIAITNLKVIRLSPAAAVTGITMPTGTALAIEPPQEVIVINEAIAANSISMAVAGTSNVANGVACVIPGVTARRFVWDKATSLWYQQT
jgi:hypothetical protein